MRGEREKEGESNVRSRRDKHRVESWSHKHRYRYVLCIPEKKVHEKFHSGPELHNQGVGVCKRAVQEALVIDCAAHNSHHVSCYCITHNV